MKIAIALTHSICLESKPLVLLNILAGGLIQRGTLNLNFWRVTFPFDGNSEQDVEHNVMQRKT